MARDLDYKHIRQSDAQDRQVAPARPARVFLLGGIFGAVVSAGITAVYFGYFTECQTAAPGVPCETPPIVEQQTGTPGMDFYSYDFFDILQRGIVIPAPGEESDAVRSTYLLQAGSFHTLSGAEAFQKELKAIGFDSEVVTSEGENNVWYVVTIGPDDDLSRINNIKLKLRVNGIEPLIIKR